MERNELFKEMKEMIDKLEKKLKAKNEQEQEVFKCWDKINEPLAKIEVDVRTSTLFGNEKARDAEVSRRRYDDEDLMKCYMNLNEEKKKLADIEAEILCLQETIKAYGTAYRGNLL